MSRRRSVMPPPLTPGFVAGEDFAFAGPVDSPKGVMTRRRTSIYVAANAKTRGAAMQAKLPAAASRVSKVKPAAAPAAAERKAVAKKSPPKRGRRSVAPAKVAPAKVAPAKVAPAKVAPAKAAAAPPPPPAAEAGPSRAKKAAPEKPKRKKVAFPEKAVVEDPDVDLARDVQVVVERLENTPGYKNILVNRDEVRQRLEAVRTSPYRVQIVCESLSEEEKEKSPPKTPKSTRSTRATLKRSTPHPNQAAKKKLFAPANEKSSPAPSASMRAPPPLGTPQLADPTALLKINLRNKVQEQMEERVAKMPNTSPYTIMEGEKDSGSPDYMFTKLKGKPKAGAKHLTSTPGNCSRAAAAPGRLVLGAISNRSQPTPARRNLSLRDLNSPSDDEDDNEVSFASKENATPSSAQPSPPTSPQPQMVTGDLGKMCVVM